MKFKLFEYSENNLLNITDNLNKMLKFKKLIKIKYVLPRYYTKENLSNDTPRKISDNIKEIYNLSTNNIITKCNTFKVNTKRNYRYFNRLGTGDKIFTIWFYGFILTFIGVSIKMIIEYDPCGDIPDTMFEIILGFFGATGISIVWPILYFACTIRFFKK